MNDRIALVSHSSELVCTSLSFVLTRLSFVFDSYLLICTGPSFVNTRLHLSALISHSSALVLPLVCNISNNLNQLKENKNSFETFFKPMWHEIKTWSYLELITSTKRVKCSSYFLASYQNKRVAIIELRNENKQNVISYSQLRKSKMSLGKKFHNKLLISHI